jgi:hypothetical protein
MTLTEMRTLVYLGLGDTSYAVGQPSPEMATEESVRLVLSEAAVRVAMDIFRVGVTLRPKFADLTVTSGQQEYPLSSGVELGTESTFVTDDDFVGLLLVEKLVTPGTPSTYYNCSWTEGADFRLKDRHRIPGFTGLSPILYLRGQRLGFVAVPANSADQYRIHYAPRPAPLTEGDPDSLKTTVPEEYHGVAVQAAIVDLYAAENTPNAERARLKYVELRESMMATLSTRFRQNPPLRRARRR